MEGALAVLYGICDRHYTSKIAINISIFRILYAVRVHCPDVERSAPPIVKANAHRG